MKTLSSLILALCFAFLFAGNLSLADRPSFTGVGDLGSSSGGGAFALSGDGKWIVGRTGMEAFRWSQQTGMITLSHLPNYDNSYTAFGVSANGSVIVGQADGQWPVLPDAAFRWQNGGMTNLGSLASNSATSAYGVSADGSTIVGESYVSYSPVVREAFAWTQSNGMVGLGFLYEGEEAGSQAWATSADGSVVVGTSWVYQNGWLTEAFRWENGKMIGLGFLDGSLNGAPPESSARDVSADGSVIVGYGRSAYGYGTEAWIWANGVLSGLGTLPGDFASQSRAVSADGSVVVGNSVTFANDVYRAIIWDSANGMRNLKAVLVDDYGLDLAGWELQQAIDISNDGRTILGIGINPTGLPEHWIAHIPEPCSAAIVAMLSPAILLRSTKHRSGRPSPQNLTK